MPKQDNMLAILWMLNSGAKITAKQIADKLEINIRTVYRYIDALCASGVPVISDAGHNGGYSLLSNVIRAPLLFELEEKKALLHAALFAKEAGYPMSEALDNAAAKLRVYSNQEQKQALSRHLAGVEVINHMVPASVQPVLAELEWAVANECTVEIAYRTGREEHAKNRRIDPYGMVYWNNRWYTVAFCHLKKELRSFRADRILTIKRTAESFKRSEGFSARESFLHNLLPDAAGKEDWMAVRIEGTADALDDLCLHWFLGHHLKERTAGQAVFTLEEESIHRYVPNFLLPYGKSLQVIEPLSLKERLVTVASDLVEYYRL